MCGRVWTVQPGGIRLVMQHVPADIPLTTAPLTATAAPADPITKPTSPQSDPPRSRPVPKGWTPRFWPEILHREFKPCDKPAEEVPAEDTVRLDYELILRGGREEVVRVKSQLVLPMALEVENLAQTDVSFPALVDQVIVRPLVTKFRSFLQRRFDAATRAQIEKEPAAVEPPFDEPPSKNVKLPKPANGAPFVMPVIEAKLPSARLPGGYGNLKP